MPGEKSIRLDRSPKQHRDRAEGLLGRAALTDQTPYGFALSQALAAEALAHAALAALPVSYLDKRAEEG